MKFLKTPFGVERFLKTTRVLRQFAQMNEHVFHPILVVYLILSNGSAFLEIKNIAALLTTPY